MQDIINNIKLIKYIRDIKLIIQSNCITNNKNYKNKIYKNKKYHNLLKLIRNQYLYDTFKKNNYNNKITINILKNMNLSLYENVCSYNNIEIVDSPMFITYEIKNNIINITNKTISDYEVKSEYDILAIIKNNKTDLLYLYLINEKRIRCHNIDTKNILKYIRQEKLQQLEEK